MAKKSILKNYIYNLTYQIIALITPLLTTPYISRVLGVDAVGNYSFSFSCVTIFAIIGNFGFSTYGQLTIANCKEDENLLSRNFISILFARFFSVCISCIAYIIYVFLFDNNILNYLLLIYLFAIAIDISWFYQGIEEFKIIAIINSVVKLLSTILVFLMVNKAEDIDLYAIIICGSLVIGNTIYIFFLKRLGIKFIFDFVEIIKQFKKSAIYFIPTIATSIYTVLDKSMIGWIKGSDFENGIYEQAQKIIHMCTTVGTSISTVIMPRMASLYHENNIEEIKIIFKKVTSFVILVLFPLSLGVYSVSSILVPVYLGKDFYGSKQIIDILSPVILIMGMNNAVGQLLLIATKRQKEYNNGVIIGSCINLILNFILISIFDAKGAAIATVFSELMILIVFYLYSKEYINIKDILKNGWKELLSAAIMFIVLQLTEDLFDCTWRGLILKSFFGITIYLVLLLILRDGFILKVIKQGKKFFLSKHTRY